MMDVEGITLNLSDGECNVGVSVDRSGLKPRIDLFELKENTGPVLTENIFEAALHIRERYFPDLDINDIEWTITNGYQRSPLEFQELDGRLIRTTYAHAFKGRYEYGRPLETVVSAPRSIDEGQRISQAETDPRFRIPTDAEISRMTGGVPVMSVRPEDLPHFRPTFYEGYNSDEIDSRIGVAYERVKSFCPAWDGQHSDLGMIGTNSDAAVLTWSTNGQPNMFVLLRPSEQLDQKNRLSSFASVRPEDVAFTIPKQAEDFISTYHEIGHMHANAKLGGHSWSRFESELHADSYGLQHYLDAGGDIDIVRAYIQERSLASFLGQTSAYRIGPILEERFLSDQPRRYDSPDNTSNSRLKAWKEYGELIARTSDRVAGYNALERYSSADIQNALLLMDQSKYSEIPDQDLLRALDDAKAVKRNPYSIWGQDRGAVFDALHDIVSSDDVDPHTARAGRSVLQAAGRFTPNLLSERIATYRQIHIDESVDRGRRNLGSDLNLTF